MYCRQMKFILTPGSRDIAERAADEVSGLLQEKRGFIEAKFLSIEETNEHTAVVFWESKEDADAANIEPTGEFQAAIVQPPSIVDYQVYTPKR